MLGRRQARLRVPSACPFDSAPSPVEMPKVRDRRLGNERVGRLEMRAVTIVRRGSTACGAKLQTGAGRAIYAVRKTIVEPVFGQIKEARGFRRFLLRGLAKVRGEWALVCLTHNILKLHWLCYASPQSKRAAVLSEEYSAESHTVEPQSAAVVV
jgi:DDE family transposase